MRLLYRIHQNRFRIQPVIDCDEAGIFKNIIKTVNFDLNLFLIFHLKPYSFQHRRIIINGQKQSPIENKKTFDSEDFSLVLTIIIQNLSVKFLQNRISDVYSITFIHK